MKRSFFLALTAVLALNTNGLATEQALPNPFKDQLSIVRPLDLPLACAKLVANSAKLDQEKTTRMVIDAAVAAHPTTVMAVVGAIAKSTPDMAAVAAARGATLQPKGAGSISKAAAIAAPNEAGRIVYSVCRALPHQYVTVANAVSSAVPALGSEILGAVTLAVPELKPFIVNAAAQAKGNDSTVWGVLNIVSQAKASPSMAQLASTASVMPVMPPPRVGLPFIDLVGTPQETNPGQSGLVPIDGRDYASP